MAFTFTAIPSLTRPLTFDSDCESFFSQLPAYQINLEALAAQCEGNATTLLTLQDIRADLAPSIAGKVSLEGNETVAGVKTFSSPLVIPAALGGNNPPRLAEFALSATRLSMRVPSLDGLNKRIFLIQHGQASLSSDSSLTVTFPTPFAGLIGWPQITPYRALMGSSSDGEITANSPTLTEFQICNGKNVSFTVAWMAMGYISPS